MNDWVSAVHTHNIVQIQRVYHLFSVVHTHFIIQIKSVYHLVSAVYTHFIISLPSGLCGASAYIYHNSYNSDVTNEYMQKYPNYEQKHLMHTAIFAKLGQTHCRLPKGTLGWQITCVTNQAWEGKPRGQQTYQGESDWVTAQSRGVPTERRMSEKMCATQQQQWSRRPTQRQGKAKTDQQAGSWTWTCMYVCMYQEWHTNKVVTRFET